MRKVDFIMDITKKITELIGKYQGRDIDLCYNILKLLQQQRNPAEGLMAFFELIGFEESDKSLPIKSEIQDDELAKMDNYGPYIYETLGLLVMKAHENELSKEEFYDRLWNRLKNDEVFENDKLRTFALLVWANSKVMPYEELGAPISMDGAEFAERVRNTKKTIKKIQHILFSNFKQKTEEASLILDEIISMDERDRAVAFVIAVDMIIKEKKYTNHLDLKELEADI